MGKKYRILMFAPAFAPFANPEAIVNNKLVLAMKSAGWHVDVITRSDHQLGDYNYGSGWEDCWVSLRMSTYAVTYRYKGRIIKVLDTLRGALRTRYPGIGCRWAAHAFDLALRLHRENHYHVILSRSLPDSGHLPALAMSKKTGLPWVANWNDASGVKNPLPVGRGGDASLGFFYNRFLQEVARNASWYTFPSERMRHYICKYLGNGAEGKSSTIPHVAMPYNIKIKSRNKNESFTICYAGNLYPGRNLGVFLNGMANFLEINKTQSRRLRLVIIGIDNIGLSKVAKKFGVESNIQTMGLMSYMNTLDCCAKSDVLLVLEAPYEEGIYLPSKFIDYVQVGRPILAISPQIGTLRDLISEYGGGIAVDCTSVEEISEAFKECYEEWERGTLDENYGSEKLYQLFSPDTIIKLYKKVFDSIGVNN
jgi:glycosyltransferase involved in cell wall biosynthesis